MMTPAVPLPSAATPLVGLLEQQLKQGDIDVPLLPEVAGRVVQLTQDPESDALQLAQLIQSDQSLAGHVMRIANSAAYSPNTTLVSLQQAITRLGMSLISEIALAASISTKMFKAPGFEQNIEHVWRHALATALWSKEIARHCRFNVETTFLCGLLHNIGWPVALQSILEKLDAEGIACDQDCVTALASHFERQTGLQVLERWKMPQTIIETLSYFDCPIQAPNAATQTTIVHSASLFARHMLTPDALDREQLCQAEILASLNLYPDEITDLLDKADTISQTMEAMST